MGIEYNRAPAQLEMDERYKTAYIQRVFKDVTQLVTVYNRSRSLQRLLASYKDLNCSFGDIVVSDDGSRPEHLAAIEKLRSTYPFRLITTPKNRGLGHNIN